MNEGLFEYQLVTWFLIIAGWLIVNWQNNKRESRKEARLMADNGKRLTLEVATFSVDYFCSADEDSASNVKSQIEILEIELERFPLFKSGSTLMSKFIVFSDAVTGGDFESQSRAVLARDGPEIREIRIARNALLGEIERQFTLHYC